MWFSLVLSLLSLCGCAEKQREESADLEKMAEQQEESATHKDLEASNQLKEEESSAAGLIILEEEEAKKNPLEMIR